MVYFVKAENKVKIGYTLDPIHRFIGLQTSCPSKIEVLLIIDGDISKEAELHALYKEYNTHGEWFEYCEPIISYIGEHANENRMYEFGFGAAETDIAPNEQILRLRIRHKLALRELGEKLNMTPQGVRDMQTREKNKAISINVLENVANALGYKFEYRFTSIEV